MSTKTKTAPLKPRAGYGISRIDQPEKKNHGWYCRMGGEAKMFSDGVWGGKRRALEAVENYRDAEFKHLPKRIQEMATRPRKVSKAASRKKPATKKTAKKK